MIEQALENESDQTLLSLIKGGDEVAFSVLLDRHADRYYSLAFRYLFDKNEAEDIVQDCFLKIWKNPDIWNPSRTASFTTWFYRIVINASSDRNRRKKNLPLQDNFSRSDGQAAQDEVLMMKEQQIYLEREINRLTELQRSALNLCFYEDLSNKEAAEIMGLSVKALQSHLMRAKLILKTRIMGNEEKRYETRR